MSIFGLDGPVFWAMAKLAKIVSINLMYCVCCVPIITIGAATTALHDCVNVLIEDKDDSKIVLRFLKTFKQKFKSSTILLLICLGFRVFLVVYQSVISRMDGMLYQSYQVVAFVLGILFLFGFQYIFPMLAKFDMKSKEVLKKAWVVSILALPWTLASIACTGGAIYISFFMNVEKIGSAIYIWLVAGFGLLAYINNLFFEKAFQKVIVKGLNNYEE